MARARGGGLPWKGSPIITPGTSDQDLFGQYAHATVKGDPDLVAGNIRSGVSIFGVIGTLSNDIQAGDEIITPAPIYGTANTYMYIGTLVGAGSGVNTGTATVNLAKGEDAVLVVLAFTFGSYGGADLIGRIIRDGNVISSANAVANQIVFAYALDKPGAGNHSYYGRLKNDSTSSRYASAALLVYEVVT